MPNFLCLAVAWLALGLTSTPLHAAINCRLPGANHALSALDEHGVRAGSPAMLLDCADRCTTHHSDELMLLSDDIPSPRHLPVVSGPDEVASWHAEIFEHLSEQREDQGSPRYCDLMF